MKNSYSWHKDKLKGEYLQVFDKIELYGQVNNVHPEIYEERMMDVIDMFLVAQENEKPVENIVGKDLEGFCKMYFADEGTLWDKTKRLPKRWVTVMWLMFVFELLPFLLDVFSGEVTSVWAPQSDMAPYVTGFFIGVVILGLFALAVKPFVFKFQWLTTNKYLLAFFIVFALGVYASSQIYSRFEIKVPALVIILVSATYLIIYYIVCGISNRKKYGTLRKPKDEFKISFWGEVNRQIEADMPRELKKRYEKKNRRLIKRGKPTLTPEEFTEKIRKEVKISKKGNLIAMIFTICLCVGMGVGEIILNKNWEGLILMGILFVVETPVMLLFRSGYRNNPNEKVINMCEEQGITVIELAEKLEEKEK